MIPLLTREAVRALDTDAVSRLALPSLVLMENAGLGATRAIQERFGDRLERVVIVGGTGQNGGDGWVVARQLVRLGHAPEAVLVGDASRVKGDAAVNLETMRRLGVALDVIAGDELAPLDARLAHATLVVDALFGTGLDRPVSGVHADAIRRIAAATARTGAPLVALDLPSGIDADTGAVLGAAPRAALTITFAAHKRGLHQHPGADHAGEIVCVSIGVPAPHEAPARIVDAEDVAALVPARRADAHKGTGGHVLVIAGSPGHTGAAVLAGLGALRAGAGLVTIAPRGAARAAIDAKVLELMTMELPPGADRAIEAVRERARDMRAAVIGPGLGLDDEGRQIALGLARTLEVPAVLDADALTAHAGALRSLREAAAPRVLTPHPGEASRLLGIPTADVQRDRYAAATRLADESGATVVLKGARTIVGSAGGRLDVCRRGTPALGTAGTGDVLGGVIGALLVALDPPDAAIAGVVLHAIAGELARVSDRGLLASEVAHAVPRALEQCRARR